MRSNAAKKIDAFEMNVTEAHMSPKTATLHLLEIAKVVEQARDLPLDKSGADFEEFLNQYRMTTTFA